MKKLTTESFINEAKQVHNDFFIYTKTDLDKRDNKNRVCIICPVHGEFWQYPSSHLHGCGCRKCKGLEQLTFEEFVERSNKVHNNKYEYVSFESTHKNAEIICPIHGVFKQLAKRHLKGQGCPHCGKEYARIYRKYKYEDFIKESNKRFNNNYEFIDIENRYENSHSKILIKCKNCGSIFEKIACDHLTSPNGGCPNCFKSKSHIEDEVTQFLTENNIKFEYQKRFDWLSLQSLDFYLPEYNVAIECQGGQHFEVIDFFGGKDGLEKYVERDKRKLQLCNEHGIEILYYSNLHIDYPYTVYEDLQQLKTIITENHESNR